MLCCFLLWDLQVLGGNRACFGALCAAQSGFWGLGRTLWLDLGLIACFGVFVSGDWLWRGWLWEKELVLGCRVGCACVCMCVWGVGFVKSVRCCVVDEGSCLVLRNGIWLT